MFLFTLVVIGCLLLLFKSTRLTGVAGLTLLSLVYPPLFLGLLLKAASSASAIIKGAMKVKEAA